MHQERNSKPASKYTDFGRRKDTLSSAAKNAPSGMVPCPFSTPKTNNTINNQAKEYKNKLSLIPKHKIHKFKILKPSRFKCI